MKISGSYHGYADTSEADDERQEKWAKQREERGFDDTETWSLDHTIAQFIYPRLKRFVEIALEHHEVDPDVQKDYADMVEGFEIMASEHYWNLCTPESRAVTDKAMALLAKHYAGLWW